MATATASQERAGLGLAGFPMLLLTLGILALALFGVIVGAGSGRPGLVTPSVLLGIAGLIVARGFFVVQPNEAVVLVFLGKYRGTVRESGWYWTNPFVARKSVSLKVRNFTSPQLKVNDADGNPVEIACVVVCARRNA